MTTSNTPVGTLTAWSAQRVGTLNHCLRKYRFRYLMKGGWEPTAPEELQIVYRLGLLQSEPTFAGTLIHKHVRRMIAIEMAGLPRNAVEQAEVACREFALAVEMGASLPLIKVRKGRAKFLRQEQGDVIAPVEILLWQEHIRKCLLTWDRLDMVSDLIKNRADIQREFLDPQSPIYSEALGVPAYLKTDVVLKTEGKVSIYDWKAGKPGKFDARQAAVYDLFVRGHFSLAEDAEVEAHFVYLAEGTVLKFKFNSEERAELLWQIGEEYTDLVITDSDPAEKRFPARPTPYCKTCPYQALCPEGKRALSQKGGN